MDLLEKLKELVAKAVTVVGTVFLSNNGFDALITFMGGGSGEALKLVSLLAAYAVWVKLVIPFVDELFKEQTKTAVVAGQPSWNARSKLF